MAILTDAEFIVFTRPDGTTFSVNADESPAVINMLLGYPENADVVADRVVIPTLDYQDYDTFSEIYGTDLADQGVAAGDIRPPDPAPASSTAPTSAPFQSDEILVATRNTTEGAPMPIDNTLPPVGDIPSFPTDIDLTEAPPSPPVPADTPIAAPQPVVVVINGRQRSVDNIPDLQRVLDSGGSVVRSDGTPAITQRIWAPGWDTPGYIVDGNPLNVILGQGWLPGQRDVVDSLQSQGLTIGATLAHQPDIDASLPIAWIIAGAGALFFLFGRRRRVASQ